MRLAFCIFKYFPYGGIQRDMARIAAACMARGHSVHIFTLRWQAPAISELEIAQAELDLVPVKGMSRHSQYQYFAEYVNAAVRRGSYDLVVGFNKMPGLDVYYAGDSCFVEKAHTQRSALYRMLPRYKSFYAAEKAVFDQYSPTQILTLSDVEVPFYRTHYRTQPERFISLPPGIERDRIAPEKVEQSQIRESLRREFNLSEDTHILLFVGSGFIKKGLDRALLAFSALPKALKSKTHLFVIGRDKGEAFERMAMRLGLKESVTFFCEGRNDVPRFLFAADGLVHPAYDEAAGMILIEAMLAGLPVLVGHNCGYAKYIKQHDSGIVLSKNFQQDDIDAGLLNLLTDERREEWQANGRQAKQDEMLFELVPTVVRQLETMAQNKQTLLAFTLFRYFPFGGLQRDFMRIAQACRSRGFQILVYCISWQGSKPEGFEILEVPVAGVSNHTKHQNFVDEVRADLKWRNPKAVIGFNKMPGLDLYYAADSCYEHKAQQNRTKLYRRSERYRALASFEQAVFGPDSSTQIMFIAPDQIQQFGRYYDNLQVRSHQLPPGVNRDRMRAENWREQRVAVRSEFNIAEDQYLLVLIGSGFKTKGLDRAIEAVASLPVDILSQTTFLVIGQSKSAQFERQAKSLGIDQRLIFASGRDDIPAILQGADVMIHPAYMESGGLVLIEAIIAGLPVIASSVCGFAFHIAQAQSGVVLAEPFEQENLNDTLLHALKDDAQRLRWSANGVEYGQTNDNLYDMPRHAVKCIEGHLAMRAGDAISTQ